MQADGAGFAASSRQRSRTPISRRRDGARLSASVVLKAMPPMPLVPRLRDAPPVPAAANPVTDFFDSTANDLPPPAIDAAQLELDESIATALASPLQFADETSVSASRASPAEANTNLQVGVVMQGVLQLQLGTGAPEEAQPRLRPRSSRRRLHAGVLHHRRQSNPCRCSAECTADGNENLRVSCQRASLLLVKHLGLLGPKDKMTAKAAKALIRRFTSR